MKNEEKLIVEVSPKDTSTYEEGFPAKTAETPADEIGIYSFLDAIKEVNING